ncbi:hypothetical protein TNCV_1239681 [Trichonephila clavipes]|nr:hypothetical protein TNCV_1239681 [Trichonephila clavipes]
MPKPSVILDHPFCDSLLSIPSDIAPTAIAADTLVRAPLRSTIRLISKSDNYSCCHWLRLRSISSNNAVHPSLQICLNNSVTLTIMPLNNLHILYAHSAFTFVSLVSTI